MLEWPYRVLNISRDSMGRPVNTFSAVAIERDAIYENIAIGNNKAWLSRCVCSGETKMGDRYWFHVFNAHSVQ